MWWRISAGMVQRVRGEDEVEGAWTEGERFEGDSGVVDADNWAVVGASVCVPRGCGCRSVSTCAQGTGTGSRAHSQSMNGVYEAKVGNKAGVVFCDEGKAHSRVGGTWSSTRKTSWLGRLVKASGWSRASRATLLGSS